MYIHKYMYIHTCIAWRCMTFYALRHKPMNVRKQQTTLVTDLTAKLLCKTRAARKSSPREFVFPTANPRWIGRSLAYKAHGLAHGGWTHGLIMLNSCLLTRYRSDLIQAEDQFLQKLASAELCWCRQVLLERCHGMAIILSRSLSKLEPRHSTCMKIQTQEWWRSHTDTAIMINYIECF